MSEMIERVARAMAKSAGREFDEFEAEDRQAALDLASDALNDAIQLLRDISDTTVSCSGLDITIQCNDYDVRERLMGFLTNSHAAPTQVGAA